jgi:type III pantothenate kinase
LKKKYSLEGLLVILIDIGNTNIVFAVSSNKILKKIIRIESNQNINQLNISFKKIIKKLIKIKRLDSPNIAIISSVVPSLNKPIIKILKINKINELFLKSKNILPFLKIDYNLNEIGADRIANSIAIIKNNISNSIVIDFGTATTFEVIKESIFSGGLIFPGINLSKNALINKTSLLRNTDVVKTKNIVAKNTKDAIRSGFYWGYVFAINGIIKKITNEKKFKPKIILTGGLANIFKNDIRPKPIIKPNLTLEGLQIIGLQYYVKN